MRQRRQLSRTSPARIAELEFRFGVGNWEEDPYSFNNLIFNGVNYRVRYEGYNYESLETLYKRLRTQEILEDQKMIREFCYGA